jgi:hypothetical protein
MNLTLAQFFKAWLCASKIELSFHDESLVEVRVIKPLILEVDRNGKS